MLEKLQAMPFRFLLLNTFQLLHIGVIHRAHAA
jgi:hypothetical protein